MNLPPLPLLLDHAKKLFADPSKAQVLRAVYPKIGKHISKEEVTEGSL